MEIVREAFNGIRDEPDRDVDRPGALGLDEDHQRIFDENPEVVVRVLRNDAFARNRFDIRFADRRIFGMQSSVQLQLILGERKQMREDAIFRVSLRSLLPPGFDSLALLLKCFLCRTFCHDALHWQVHIGDDSAFPRERIGVRNGRARVQPHDSNALSVSISPLSKVQSLFR